MAAFSTILAAAGLALTAGTTAASLLSPKGGGGGGGGGSVTPAVAKAPEVPTLEDPAIAAASLLQQTNAANAKGRASTILTSGMGDESAVTTNKKQLLGA